MPGKLKSGMESLSGMDLSDVRVHRNSLKPAGLGALAYAQGNQIHLGPGQERHLPHEAWHVVQQKQGRVKPTMQMKGKVNINDNAGLEHEADVMGQRALQHGGANVINSDLSIQKMEGAGEMPVQRVRIPTNGGAFEDTQYETYNGHSKNVNSQGRVLGGIINLEFHPNPKVITSGRIALIQAVTPTLTATGSDTPVSEHLNPSIAGRNTSIDVPNSGTYNDSFSNSPVYGALKRPATGTLADIPEPKGRKNNIGSVDGKGNVTPASLWDNPKRNTEDADAFAMNFETAALVLDGPHAGRYLGSISWGCSWQKGQTEAVLQNITLVSRDTPSDSFYEASEAWNIGHINAYVENIPERTEATGEQDGEFAHLFANPNIKRRKAPKVLKQLDTIKLPDRPG